MFSVVVYFVIIAVVAAVLFWLSSVVFGRGEVLPPVAEGRTLTQLPQSGIRKTDVSNLAFQVRFRGYDVTEVDWALAQLGAEIERLRSLTGEEAKKGKTRAPVAKTAGGKRATPSIATR